MSDQTIRAGDLVMVVKPTRCGCTKSLGNIFTVLGVTAVDAGGRCVHCGTDTYPKGTITASDGDDNYIELTRLQKINPPAISSHTEHKEALSA